MTLKNAAAGLPTAVASRCCGAILAHRARARKLDPGVCARAAQRDGLHLRSRHGDRRDLHGLDQGRDRPVGRPACRPGWPAARRDWVRPRGGCSIAPRRPRREPASSSRERASPSRVLARSAGMRRVSCVGRGARLVASLGQQAGRSRMQGAGRGCAARRSRKAARRPRLSWRRKARSRCRDRDRMRHLDTCGPPGRGARGQRFPPAHETGVAGREHTHDAGGGEGAGCEGSRRGAGLHRQRGRRNMRGDGVCGRHARCRIRCHRGAGARQYRKRCSMQ